MIANQLLNLASIIKFNYELIYNDPPGSDRHGPFLLDVVNSQLHSLHS